MAENVARPWADCLKATSERKANHQIYSEKFFGGEFETSTNYKDPELQKLINKNNVRENAKCIPHAMRHGLKIKTMMMTVLLG